MTAVFGLVLELIYRRGIIALAGTLVSTFGLVLADQMPLTLAPNIQPLQAVLRSNYWLVIHVLTIVSSYAAFALAWGLGNLNLGLMLFAPHRRDTIKAMSQLCYRAIQIGVVLLAAGTLLGGFWAAESWGRFWGWDPKEVWALIALLCYVIPLHARYVGWVKDFGLAACSVVCFASVVMAWYGVNFVLGAGLHSYGFGGGNDAWVYWGGLINISLVVHAALRYHYWTTEPVAASRQCSYQPDAPARTVFPSLVRRTPSSGDGDKLPQVKHRVRHVAPNRRAGHHAVARHTMKLRQLCHEPLESLTFLGKRRATERRVK